jgi:hypothetical protein
VLDVGDERISHDLLELLCVIIVVTRVVPQVEWHQPRMLEDCLCQKLEALNSDFVLFEDETLYVFISFECKTQLFSKVVPKIVSRDVYALYSKLWDVENQWISQPKLPPEQVSDFILRADQLGKAAYVLVLQVIEL